MGKIKSKMVRRATNILLSKEIGFTENFEENKRIIGNTMPSKKIRNQVAGLLAKIKKQEKSKAGLK